MIGCDGSKTAKNNLVEMQKTAQTNATQRFYYQQAVYQRCLLLGGVPIIETNQFQRVEDQMRVIRCEFQPR